MTIEMLTNRAEMREALVERGGRNLPMAAGGASSGTARKGHSCTGTENLMEAVVERENMLNAYTRAKGLMRGGLGESRAWQSETNGRGPWWNSGASHMNQAFAKKFFDRLGLVSLLDLVLRFQCSP